MGDFGKRGDLSSGEPELRGWKRRSVTCLQQFAKRLFPMPGSCSADQSSQLCFTHTLKPHKAHSHAQPTPSAAFSQSDAFSKENAYLAPGWQDTRGPAAASTQDPTSRVLTRIGCWACSSSPKVLPGDLHPPHAFAPSPAATTPARPRAAPAAAALLSCPAVPQHSRALTGSQALTGGCRPGRGGYK